MHRRFAIALALAVFVVLAFAATAQALTYTSVRGIVQPNGATIWIEFDYHSYNASLWEAEQYRIKYTNPAGGHTNSFYLLRTDTAGSDKYICVNHTIGSAWHTHTGHAEFHKDFTYHETWWADWNIQAFWWWL